ncbi:hypothetical protein BGW36DRAFT_89562 [Talaromyces proteolyticus]|uniref:Amine oxidase domain-containing protein n=1 Tax=Talaromyces proteolyticus TaxID=1131652 RepID=A0AAD4Q030_9EURO|nr:uncharacterized protein BGW36DRAFT_89562 [Talaromyces proteolyticus]KAH8703653.1 hypothetical protein BGW36DRAFT_89562 [Talaromyces proteolyticus]
MTEQKHAKKTVAVIGSGMAGLVTAYLIHQDKQCRYHVEVFETQDQLSLDSASYTISSADVYPSLPNRIDIPMRAFDEGFHINLKRMYDYLGVGYITQKFVYSLSKYSTVDGKKSPPYFFHSSSNHRFPPVRPEGYGYLQWIVQIMYLAACYFWFIVCCFVVKPKMASTSKEEETLEVYVKRIRLPWHFVKNYLLPLMSSVTTCSHDALLSFPALDAVDYAKRTYRQPHYTVIGGVQGVQSKLSKGLAVSFQATVTSVKRADTKLEVTWVDSNDKSHISYFDHVVMAVTPDVVGALFEPLREVMREIPVIWGESVVHYDSSAIANSSRLLEKYSAKTQKAGDQAQIMHITSDPLSTESIHQQSSTLVTNFPISPIDPNKIAHRARLARVLRTPKSREIVNDIFTLDKSELKPPKEELFWYNGKDNVWLVGAWCWDGMVLLEGCIVSAMRVATSLGVEIPWTITSSES